MSLSKKMEAKQKLLEVISTIWPLPEFEKMRLKSFLILLDISKYEIFFGGMKKINVRYENFLRF